MAASADPLAVWTIAAAIAAAASAIASSAALVFLAIQTGQNARASELAVLQAFSGGTRTLWAACIDAGEDQFRFEFYVGNILGHFELFCIAIRERSLSGKSLDFIEETICDYLCQMQASDYSEIVGRLLDAPHVCKELKAFCLQNRARLPDAAGVYQMLNIPTHSL